jgi:hypothetical protein
VFLNDLCVCNSHLATGAHVCKLALQCEQAAVAVRAAARAVRQSCCYMSLTPDCASAYSSASHVSEQQRVGVQVACASLTYLSLLFVIALRHDMNLCRRASESTSSTKSAQLQSTGRAFDKVHKYYETMVSDSKHALWKLSSTRHSLNTTKSIKHQANASSVGTAQAVRSANADFSRAFITAARQHVM